MPLIVYLYIRIDPSAADSATATPSKITRFLRFAPTLHPNQLPAAGIGYGHSAAQVGSPTSRRDGRHRNSGPGFNGVGMTLTTDWTLPVRAVCCWPAFQFAFTETSLYWLKIWARPVTLRPRIAHRAATQVRKDDRGEAIDIPLSFVGPREGSLGNRRRGAAVHDPNRVGVPPSSLAFVGGRSVELRPLGAGGWDETLGLLN